MGTDTDIKIIEVTQECIDEANNWKYKGLAGQRSENCPVAQALKRKGFKDIEVHKMEVYNLRTRYAAYLPAVATRFIEDWDSNLEVKPFAFMMNTEIVK